MIVYMNLSYDKYTSKDKVDEIKAFREAVISSFDEVFAGNEDKVISIEFAYRAQAEDNDTPRPQVVVVDGGSDDPFAAEESK